MVKQRCPFWGMSRFGESRSDDAERSSLGKKRKTHGQRPVGFAIGGYGNWLLAVLQGVNDCLLAIQDR
jgi:hypothetical protein